MRIDNFLLAFACLGSAAAAAIDNAAVAPRADVEIRGDEHELAKRRGGGGHVSSGGHSSGEEGSSG